VIFSLFNIILIFITLKEVGSQSRGKKTQGGYKMSTKGKISAVLAGENVTQFVIGQILQGLPLKVKIEDTTHEALVESLDFTIGQDHAFANVKVLSFPPEEIRVSIDTNGKVRVMPKENRA
jgi:hypothetical protein